MNLNYSSAVCDDIYSHTAAQVATQQLVAGLQVCPDSSSRLILAFQSHSAVLQNIPGLIFILIAGPLSDTYGRNFLMVLSLIGYLILNIVFLVNSIFFHQLKVRA